MASNYCPGAHHRLHEALRKIVRRDRALHQSWYANYLPLDVGNSIIEVAKEKIYLFDGGEMLVCTHRQTIRFRLPLCDTPEIRTAFKFRKRRGDQLTSVGTVEVGMEALRMARKIN